METEKYYFVHPLPGVTGKFGPGKFGPGKFGPGKFALMNVKCYFTS